MSKRLSALTHGNLSYCDPKVKRDFHREAKRALRKVAAELGLERKDYDLRSNMGGIAVSGEITLHTDFVYIQISQSAIAGANTAVLLRTCKSRKDFTGGCNNFRPIEAMENPSRVADLVRDLTGRDR